VRTQPWTKWEDDLVRELYPQGKPLAEIVDRFPGRSVNGLRIHTKELKLKFGEGWEKIPPANRSLADLLSDRAKEFGRKQAHHEAKRNLTLKIEEFKPFGVLFFGDPHVDDPGCDIDALVYYLETAKGTDGLYAVNVGDLTNNWVGGLQRLYAHQTTTDDEATELLEWLVSQVPWLLMVLGNHDRWGPLAAHICQSHGVTYASHGAKMTVESYGQPIVMDVRHTHRGNSMYNASHGQLKKSFRGSDADIIIGGHTHSSAYTMVKNGVTGKISHCVRIGAFKRYDDSPTGRL
jgi:UDP-2,3-diacylglucosamine pyrophosphatase LpxH